MMLSFRSSNKLTIINTLSGQFRSFTLLLFDFRGLKLSFKSSGVSTMLSGGMTTLFDSFVPFPQIRLLISTTWVTALDGVNVVFRNFVLFTPRLLFFREDLVSRRDMLITCM